MTIYDYIWKTLFLPWWILFVILLGRTEKHPLFGYPIAWPKGWSLLGKIGRVVPRIE